MFPIWFWILLSFGLVFLILRLQHYVDSRDKENHDPYLVVREVCDYSKLKYKRCPNLEMWGFKWSILITLSVVNIALVLALYLR